MRWVQNLHHHGPSLARAPCGACARRSPSLLFALTVGEPPGGQVSLFGLFRANPVMFPETRFTLGRVVRDFFQGMAGLSQPAIFKLLVRASNATLVSPPARCVAKSHLDQSSTRAARALARSTPARGLGEPCRLGHNFAVCAEGSSVLCEVGIAQAGADHAVGIALFLVHSDGAVHAVVDHDDVRAVLHGGGELTVHQEAAVACKGHDGSCGLVGLTSSQSGASPARVLRHDRRHSSSRNPRSFMATTPHPDPYLRL
jgi:hypothetical protein